MEKQNKVWDKIANSWNKYRKVISPTVKDFLKNSNGKILDLGCGSGRNLIYKKDQEYYCVDFSKKMIELAKKNAKEKKINANFFVMKSNKLNFKDNYFDSVLCWALLHCIDSKEKRKKTLKEIYRVLKPNAKALISTWSNNSPRLKNKPKECFVPWSIKENIKEQRYTYIYDLEELKEDLEDIGFKIEIIWEERNINAICTKVS